MTVVRPELQFGVTELDAASCVSGFREKPRSEHWINGGFFCFEAGVLELPRARQRARARAARAPRARRASCAAYRHEGFWECMDTYKDAVALNDLWDSGEAPWRSRAASQGSCRRTSPRPPESVGRAVRARLALHALASRHVRRHAGTTRRTRYSATGSRMPRSRRSPANDQR